jgi:hypothetical protein
MKHYRTWFGRKRRDARRDLKNLPQSSQQPAHVAPAKGFAIMREPRTPLFPIAFSS